MSAGSRGFRLVGAMGATFLAASLGACVFALDFEELQAGDGGGSGTNAVVLNDAASALAEATCERILACVGPARPLFLGDADCKELFLKGYQNSILDGAEILTTETFEYHSTLLPACVEALRTRPCGDVGHLAECEAALEGKVAQGGACVHPLECSSGLYCDVSASCPGTCLPLLGEGAECLDGSQCANGLDCATQATGKHCSPLVAAEGGACDNGEPECALNMLCLGKGTSGPGTCALISTTFDADLGNACNVRSGPFCSEGLVCKLDSYADLYGGGDGSCSTPSEAGAACTVSLPDPCPRNFYCKTLGPQSIDGTCAALPGTLEPCAPELTVVKQPCRSGTTCVTLPAGKVCQAITENDAACSTSATCYSNYCLDEKCSPLACSSGS